MTRKIRSKENKNTAYCNLSEGSGSKLMARLTEISLLEPDFCLANDDGASVISDKVLCHTH